MGSGSSVMDKHVVVIGGGYAGLAAAQRIEKFACVTLVDKTEAFFHKIASLRAVTQELYERRAVLSRENALRRGGTVKTGEVVDVYPEKRVVRLASGEELHYDALVVATGARGPYPSQLPEGARTAAEMRAALAEARAAVAEHQHVLIAGGGPVGVELAAEIKEAHPDRTVTLVHGGAALLSNSQPPLKPSFQAAIKRQLECMGVEVRLGERSPFAPPAGGGMLVHQDVGGRDTLVFTAFGNQGANSDAFGALPRDEQGFVRVRPTLQVEGLDDVYAVGDVNNLPDTKLAFLADLEGAHAAANVKRQLRGGRPAPYKSMLAGAKYGIAFVPLGTTAGRSQMKGMQLGTWVTQKAKGADLFSAKNARMVGVGLAR